MKTTKTVSVKCIGLERKERKMLERKTRAKTRRVVRVENETK